jgi:hypothetical protein
MNCEQFLFEVSYLVESGEYDDAGPDVSGHLRTCSRCRARFQQLREQYHSRERAEFTPLMSERLHQRINLQMTDAQINDPQINDPRINDLRINDLRINTPQINDLPNDDLLISQRPLSPKMWLQMALTCLILVGSIVGIAYQNHPTATPPVFARR